MPEEQILERAAVVGPSGEGVPVRLVLGPQPPAQDGKGSAHVGTHVQGCRRVHPCSPPHRAGVDETEVALGLALDLVVVALPIEDARAGGKPAEAGLWVVAFRARPALGVLEELAGLGLELERGEEVPVEELDPAQQVREMEETRPQLGAQLFRFQELFAARGPHELGGDPRGLAQRQGLRLELGDAARDPRPRFACRREGLGPCAQSLQSREEGGTAAEAALQSRPDASLQRFEVLPWTRHSRHPPGSGDAAAMDLQPPRDIPAIL